MKKEALQVTTNCNNIFPLFQGLDWSYETPLPEWAQPNWIQPPDEDDEEDATANVPNVKME